MIEEEVLTFEDEHALPERWTIGSPEYTQGKKNITTIKYRDALNNLEHLVVQRLLELTKLNVSGLGRNSYSSFHNKHITNFCRV